MISFDLTGKVAVVTGASSGLGQQFARALSEQGCDVAILARRKERLKEFVSKQGLGQNAFEKKVGIAVGYLASKSVSVTSDTIEKVIENFPNLNLHWLITGEGEMLKNSGTMIGSNQGDGNKIEYKNGGNVGVGNTVNVTLPELGTQKIIKPDGTVELTSIGSNGNTSDKLQMENEALKEKISHLMDNMQLKDDLIASLRDTIELLKHRQ